MLLTGALLWSLNTVCLAEALYYEARGEDFDSQLLVAEVVLNRTKDAEYPDTPCGVVYQEGQFSWSDDKPAKRETKAWAAALALATRIQLGQEPLLGTEAVAFHSGNRPKNFGNFELLGKVGNHKFYTKGN